jgi:hypothetical protein
MKSMAQEQAHGAGACRRSKRGVACHGILEVGKKYKQLSTFLIKKSRNIIKTSKSKYNEIKTVKTRG